ncbi:MAG: competence protein ComEC family protein [Muribaculum sp.]|nr:competence protein ComEC family protein [Muribaculum sp.]
MIPLLPITIALIAGILLKVSGINALYLLIPVLINIYLIKHHKNSASIIITAGIAGFGIAYIHYPIPLESAFKSTKHNYSGVIKETKEYESSRMMIVEIDSCNSHHIRPFLAKLFIPSSLPVLDITDRIGFITSLDDLRSETYLPDEIDYNLPLMRQGVIANGIVEPGDINYTYPEKGLINSIYRLRIKLTRTIALTPIKASTKDFLITVLTGDQRFLMSDTRDLFSNTGLAHILALSGLHVGILSWIISILLLPLTISGLRNYKIIITIVLLWLFAIMTGLAPSVVRAVTMTSLYLIAILCERKHASFNSLCFSAIVILLFSPFSLLSIGFQLSFIAVTTILLFSTKINPVNPKRKILHSAIGYITVTASAMLGTGIVSAYYFGIFPMYFMVTNIASSILLPFLLGSGIITVICQLAGFSIIWLSAVVDILYDIIMKTTSMVASLPGAYIDNINLPVLVIPLYFLSLTFLALLIYQRKTVWTISLISTVIAIIAISIADKPCYNENVLYIPPSHSSTFILVRENQKFWLISTLLGIEQQDLKSRLERQYRKYMSKRDIDSISILPKVYKSRLLARKGSIVRTKERTIAIINSPNHVVNFNIPIDYALVTKGFSGDITSIHDNMKVDTIVLSGDIHLRRHNRYAGELADAGIVFKRLRYEPIILE